MNPTWLTKLSTTKNTVVRHLYDLKLSHEDETKVKKAIRKSEEIYGETGTTQEKKQEYLGMDLYFTSEVKLKVIIIKNLDGVIG